MTDQTSETPIEDLLAEMQPRDVTVRILLRQELLTRHAALEAELVAAQRYDERQNREPVAPGIAQHIVDLEAEIESAKRAFTFRSIGRKAWNDLLAKFPPTKEELKLNPRAQFSGKFPVRAVAASSLSPKLTVEQAQAFEERLPVAEFDALWQGAVDANMGGHDAPKSVAAGVILRLSGASATTSSHEESLDQRS